MLEFKNVTKSFGKLTALKDVSFSVGNGEFVFLCGPSGAGKTTILRLILREILPSQGEINLDGQSVTKIHSKDIPKLRQAMGVIFQDFKIIPEKTLRENVEVALAVIGLPKKEWDARTNHVLELVGLTERASLFPSQLSGGELQRVSMARALIVNPKLILADEPTGNLDWETAERIMELFDKVNREGKTIIMATHNKLIIDKMAKRIVNLKDGKVVNDLKSKVKNNSEKPK